MKPPSLADEIAAAADAAWAAVPNYLRATTPAATWGSTRVEFSDRRQG